MRINGDEHARSSEYEITEIEGCDESSMGRRKCGRSSNGQGGVILRGNTYYARYTDAMGVRREVSTHTSNREEALKALKNYTKPILEAKSTEEIKLNLQHELDVIELRKEEKKVDRIKLDELVDKFVNHRILLDATTSTKEGYARHLRALIRIIKSKYPNLKTIDDVTNEVIDGILGELAKHYTPASYNLAISTYKRCWGMFSRSNPFLKVKNRKVDKSRHRQVISEDDLRRIFDKCRDAKERAIWGVGVYTGLRCGDVCNLTYGALDRDLKSITWMPQKTKRHMSQPLTTPICPTLKSLLLEVLDSFKIGNPMFKDTPLWEDYKRRYATRRINPWFAKTLKRAGLSSSHIDENGHRQFDTGFHITRLAFVTFASKYLSPIHVSKIVGHSSLKMTSHYCQENQDVLMEGISQMPNFTKPKEANENAPKKDETQEVMKVLGEMKEGQETPLETLLRLISKANKYLKVG